MKSRIWIQWMAVCLFVGGTTGFSADYYINDSSTNLDVYTSAEGHDSNPGTASSPKATLAGVLTNSFFPGDVIYIDTGTYPSGTIISNAVSGAVGTPILFQGSTNGSYLTGSGVNLTVQGSYLDFLNIRMQGGSEGVRLWGANNCNFEKVWASSNGFAFYLLSGASNSFRQCVAEGGGPAVRSTGSTRYNYFGNSILLSDNAIVLYTTSISISNISGCIIGGGGGQAFISSSSVPEEGMRNIFWDLSHFGSGMETLSDVINLKPGWEGNTYADPLFLDSNGLDYHVLSEAGYVSNGVWVTNALVGFSPAVDFGSISSLGWTNEPAPNGSRVNVGLFGGTAEASKSRLDDWLFAMSYNDGGTLVKTGRLEWAGGNLGSGATVDIQFSTNSGASWSNIVTGIAATNESYIWVPTLAMEYPAVLWRVVNATNSEASSTNANPFSVRATTNTTFTFYVNDASTNGDIYCSAIGSSTNDGVTPATPKRSLQEILDGYDLEGDDTVYVDTGDYVTNVTTEISSFDSGSAGHPIRIIGSPAGSLFGRGSTSADTLQLTSASYLEFENLQLTSGRYGLYGLSSADVTLRNVQFTGNRYGVFLSGSSRYFSFENCLSADNTLYAFSGTASISNQWLNGVMWGSPTLIVAKTNSLSISNSILGNGTSLFGSYVVHGDNNLVSDIDVGLSYATFSALQNDEFGWGKSLLADPEFADEPGGDYHLKSLMGRYDPVSELFVTNDLVHSPAIDLGSPSSMAYTNEPAPNGSRLNAGMYGGTDQASKSRTNAWLQVLSYMDGGTLDAPSGSWLNWIGGNYSTTSTVTLWLSRDNGDSWESLVAGVTATNGSYFYINADTNDPSSLYALWKVSLDGIIPPVESQPPTNFNYKNGVFSFFVNDASTNGDVYCTAIGDDDNLGVSAGSPVESLAALVVRYQLGPGDRVYVDTGSYYYPVTPVVLTSQDSGGPGDPLVILGSTNHLAGGTVYGRRNSVTALGFNIGAAASNIILRDIIMTNMTRGVVISNAFNITLEGMEVREGKFRAYDLMAYAQDIELLRCVAHGGGTGVGLHQVTNVTIRNSVLWESKSNAVYLGSQVGVEVENTILASAQARATLYSYSSLVGFSSDYNGLHAGDNTRVAINRSAGTHADNLSAWATLSGGADLNSIPGNPEMADSAAYDYHLKTEQPLGRHLPDGQLTSDSLSSPLLDVGNPDSDVSEEPMPNGGRVNMGLFGGTDEASIAWTAPWLKTITYSDGGSLQDGSLSLRWTPGSGFSNETVKVEVSVDGGDSWGTMVTSGIPATNRITSWELTGLSDTPAALWRITCLERTNVVAESPVFFSIRNQPLNIFVNNADTNEAVYTTGPGQSDNWQATAAAPLDSVRTVFERFDLEAGDQVWVDTGVYEESEPIVIGMKNSGTSTNPVRLTGNQVFPYSGTVLKRRSRTIGANGIEIANAEGIHLDSLTVSNTWIGIHTEHSDAVLLERIRSTYSVTNSIYAGVGSEMEITRSILDQSLYFGLHAQTGSVVSLNGCLIQENEQSAIHLRGGDVEVVNSIMKASGLQRYIYYFAGTTSELISDHNNIRVSASASVAGGSGGRPSDRFLYDWQQSSGGANDVQSFGYDSRFADEEALDFHLESEYGRFEPLAGAYMTNDTETSILIDLGSTNSAYASEPMENGGRINVGLYGDTDEASKSSGLGALVPLTMSDGGTIRGEATLFWAWNGIAPNELLDLQFSPDGGVTWTNIDVGVFADKGSEGYSWVTTNFPSTAMGVWRVMTTNEPPIIGQTETFFAIKNEPLAYYVNDSSTNGDVYCSMVGSSANSGLSSDSPLDSIPYLLGRYKVEAGDVLYVDTGIYPRTTPLIINAPAPAGTTNFLVIQGSTNEAAGGSVLTNSSGSVIDMQDSQFVELRDLRLAGGDEGLTLTESSENLFFRIRSDGAQKLGYSLTPASDLNQFIQCAAINFFQTGFYVASPKGDLIAPCTNFWSGGILAPVPADTNGVAVSTGALMSAHSGRVYVSNSVFVASSPRHPIYKTAPDVILGDYNCFHKSFTNSILADVSSTLPPYGLEVISFGNLESWSAWSQSDTNSIGADPLFADLIGGRLHPKSTFGRYSPEDEMFVNDTVNSPLLDTADPLLDWSLETDPNGSRRNMGIFGNDSQASRTPTNGTFVLLSLNQGGVVSGTHTLRWLARGGATNAGHLVNIQLSTNSGSTWQTIGSGVDSSSGIYEWNTTTNPTVSAARWRVQSQSQVSWVTASEQDFVIHNTNLTYYVNDASTNNDVYTSAPGSSSNTGVHPASPVLSLSEILTRYDVEPGDQILIDTGDYIQEVTPKVGYLDSGTSLNPIWIQGSTNAAGTAFLTSGIEFDNARGVMLRNIEFTSQTAVHDVALINRSEDITFERVDVRGARGNGIVISTSSNTVLRNFSSSFAKTNGVRSVASYNTRLEFGVLWSNQVAQVQARNQLPGAVVASRESSFVSVSNCIMGAFGVRKAAYEIRGTLFANYNNIYLSQGALAALHYKNSFGQEFDSVGTWASSTNGQDADSLALEPDFVSVVLGDFHLKSSAGRYDPESGTFTNDPPEENSSLIDAGTPSILCQEPDPNGSRVNMGRYGNTQEASMTPTNSSLSLISFHDGGRASGTNAYITWNGRGAVTNNGSTLSIFYSSDGGSNWITLVSNLVSSGVGSWSWDTTLYDQSVQAKLMIEATDGASDVTDIFSLRNGPFSFYINNSSTNGDVYCTAVGDDANTGLTNSLPMASLNALLARYDLDSSTNGGDVVYIDTGVYEGLDPWQITQVDSAGDLDLPPVVFQGSTNSLLSGTVLDRASDLYGIQVDYAVGVELRNITVSNTANGGSAVVFNNCYDVAADWVMVNRANIAFQLSGGSDLRVSHSLVLSANQGVLVDKYTPTATNRVFPVIENSVFWETAGSAIEITAFNEATVRNNIFSVAPLQYVYELAQLGEITSDYNAIWLEGGGRVYRKIMSGKISPVPIIYDSVGSWAAASGQDLHSYDGDPLLVNPDGRDFHLMSRAGHWSVAAGTWIDDLVTSPLIDAGRIDDTAWTNEPDFNGGRVNIGLYGGTEWASKSDTNSALYLLSLNRGGVASGQVKLNWRAAGASTGHTVRIQVSINDGADWSTVAEGVSAALGGISWFSESLPASPLALWRVVDEDDSGVSATSELNFVLHNGSVHYYVNDEFTDGDVYCDAAIGDSGNTGASPDSPKRWVSEIIDTYNLEAGDVVYVDTGRYQTPETTVMGDLDSGGISQIESEQITVQGSTNALMGGSQFIISDPTADAFYADAAHGIRFKQMEILGASNAIVADTSYFIAVDQMNIHGCANGVYGTASSNILVSHSLLTGNSSAGVRANVNKIGTMYLDSNMMWSNRYGVYLSGGSVNISNCVLGMVAPDSYGFYVHSDILPNALRSDYNNVFTPLASCAAGGTQTGRDSTARTNRSLTLSAWRGKTGQEIHSLEQDPELADPGNGDYHLKSRGGRYSLLSGWEIDSVTSPLIDAGNSSSMDWTLEPDPNGRRLNMGPYGGTGEASKTPDEGLIICIYPGTAARVTSATSLTWSVIGGATNYTVLIEYSADDGILWTNIVSGIPAVQESYFWHAELFQKSALARWRITCLEDLAVTDTSGRFINVAPDGGGAIPTPGTIPYYVNDGSTNGDVYCTAIGNDDNHGLTPDQPKANLQAILDHNILSPDDVVYVDSGTYPAGSPPVEINQQDSGWSNLYVTIQGSTNPAVETVFLAPGQSTPYAFSLQYAVNIRLKDLTIRNARIGVEAYQSIGCIFENVRVVNNDAIGIFLKSCDDFQLIHSTLWKNSSRTGGVAIALSDSSAMIENSVLWGSPVAIDILSGNISVTNSALDATGSDGRIYQFSSSASAENNFRGDYNSYSRNNSALIAVQLRLTGPSEYYNDIPTWSSLVSSDQHSMLEEPLFENEITGDFHPQSTEGRYEGGAWIKDTVLSPLVDAGAPNWDFSNEPDPNGSYVNIGAYGNSDEASMTQTNPPWLQVISYNEEGGLMNGDCLMYWLHGGMPDGATVRVDYSTDYQLTWTDIVTNQLAESREYPWDVTGLPMALDLYWRVTYEANTNIYSVSKANSLRSGPLDFYVNDASTNGDVYCQGPGLAWGTLPPPGTNAATPLNSVQNLMSNYLVREGDRIYVDTGDYTVTDVSPIVFTDRNKGIGTGTNSLRVYGSTNFLAGGSRFLGNGTSDGIRLQNTRYVELHDLQISTMHNALSMESVSSILMDGMVLHHNSSNGVWVSNGSDVEVRNSRIWANSKYGYFTLANISAGRTILNSTLWGNELGGIWNARGAMTISNSIVGATNEYSLLWEMSGGQISGDYNLYHVGPGAGIGFNEFESDTYSNLRHWQSKDRDVHSFVTDPLFVSPDTGDFHLQSRSGYYTNGTWPVSTQTSWAIDAGDPSNLDFVNEPEPNGGKINIGAYGGTPEASMTQISPAELFPTTLRDGGVAPNGQPLYWLSRGIDSTNTVRIEYSPDNGATWVLVASSLLIDDVPYAWYTSVDPTPVALWKLVLESDTNITAVTPTNFILRPTFLTYYVNDLVSTNGDVYTTALGSPTNKGYTADSPLDSVQTVLRIFQLMGGDRLKVDTGVYTLTNSILITAKNSGDSTNDVYFIGSTNIAAGGSQFEPAADLLFPAIEISGARYASISGFHLAGFTNGVQILETAHDCSISDSIISGSTGPGIKISEAKEISINRTLIRDGHTNGIFATYGTAFINGCVIWSNRASAIDLGESIQVRVTNSSLQASGPGQYCYRSWGTSSVIKANYNNLYLENGAQIGFWQGLQYEKLPQWVRGVAQDQYSLSTDPLFHDPSTGDYHPRSPEGRYQPGAGWVQDPLITTNEEYIIHPHRNYSALIDMGLPSAAWSNEPDPNGEHLNLGIYGSREDASMSDTNQWIRVVTAMAGGLMYGDINLTWGYGGPLASNELVRMEYSFDDGDTWVRIGETAVGSREYFWASDLRQAGIPLFPSSPAARWRIFLLSNTNIWDISAPVGLRNSPFTYYLNDVYTNNDVYCSAPGSDTNKGYYSASPLLTLEHMLATNDFQPGDLVFIDTGTYVFTDTNSAILWANSDGGEEGQPVVVRGSTHSNGSHIIGDGHFSQRAFFFMEASYIDMSDVNFASAPIEFSGQSLMISNLWMTNGNVGVYSHYSSFGNIRLDRGSLLMSGRENEIDRMQQRWGESTLIGTNVTVQRSVVYTTNALRTGIWVNAESAIISNCTVVSTHGAAIGKRGSGTLRLGHNILIAGGAGSSSVIAWEDGGLLSDWNNLLARDSAWVGTRNGKWEKLAYWKVASGQDANSVSFDPLFQNEAQGDFHLNSEVGRWSPILNGWDLDGVQSPMIDLGDPYVGTGQEPMPNGYRRNLGGYGGTEHASMSLSSLWLTALTQNDGGVLAGTNVVLRWAAGNAGDKTVTLQYYDGSVWTNIATGLPATDGTYIWNSIGFPDAFDAYWRVVAEDGSGTSDQTDSPFALRNYPHDFYVNDVTTNGDIYCSAIGSSGNDGLTPATPRLALQEILDTYDLEGGDTVYVDTGTYSAGSDIRVIWSRSGDTNGNVVIQGNTNGAYTVLERSGWTNYPSIGLDIKASQIQLNHFTVRGVDRAILMESNRNITVQGLVIRDAPNGLILHDTENSDVRNSAFWNTGWGITLENTSTSVLENLTFAKSTLAGIRLEQTLVDTLQNNIFIPEANAYAYWIGTSTTLLQNATMDYNLYDFSKLDPEASGFYSGATTNFRKYQLVLDREYRSAITNADLADIEYTGDFHPHSAEGRWTPAGWASDGSTSWAVDHGNPDSDYSEEPDTNGERVNIGMYGNTVQASQGSTNILYDVRTLNESNMVISQADSIWPLVWSAHLLDGAQMVLVQFSGNNGATWTTLTNTSAYTEYYVWTAGPDFATSEGRWRVIDEAGMSVTNSATNAYPFVVRVNDLNIIRLYPENGLARMDWEGGVQGPRYRIEYSDDFGQTWLQWDPKYNGPARMNMSDFEIPVGASQLEYIYEDRTSYLRRTRWYRIFEIRE
jgi:Right handed beta helix region/Periplasmic copper-binding protein (NosD)